MRQITGDDYLHLPLAERRTLDDWLHRFGIHSSDVIRVAEERDAHIHIHFRQRSEDGEMRPNDSKGEFILHDGADWPL